MLLERWVLIFEFCEGQVSAIFIWESSLKKDILEDRLPLSPWLGSCVVIHQLGIKFDCVRVVTLFVTPRCNAQ